MNDLRIENFGLVQDGFGNTVGRVDDLGLVHNTLGHTVGRFNELGIVDTFDHQIGRFNSISMIEESFPNALKTAFEPLERCEPVLPMFEQRYDSFSKPYEPEPLRYKPVRDLLQL